jgi:hypothetical protein
MTTRARKGLMGAIVTQRDTRRIDDRKRSVETRHLSRGSPARPPELPAYGHASRRVAILRSARLNRTGPGQGIPRRCRHETDVSAPCCGKHRRFCGTIPAVCTSGWSRTTLHPQFFGARKAPRAGNETPSSWLRPPWAANCARGNSGHPRLFLQSGAALSTALRSGNLRRRVTGKAPPAPLRRIAG